MKPTNPKPHPSLLIAPPRPDPEVLLKWATQKYPARSQDMMDWLYSWYFWHEWDGKTSSIEGSHEFARATARARMEALDNTNQLQNTTEEAIVLQLLYAEATQWYRFEEIDDIRMLIKDKVVEQLNKEEIRRQRAEAEGKPYKRGGKAYEYENLLQVVNTLEKMGTPKESIIPVGANFSKAVRASGPILDILETTAIPENEKLAEVQEILRAVADPKITVVKFEEDIRKRTGKMKNLPDPIDGSIVITPKGSELVVIQTSRSYSAAIQGALKGLVDLHVTDPARLIKDMSQLMLPKTNNMCQYELHETAAGARFVPGKGVYLPTPDELGNIILLELAKVEFYLFQLLDANQDAFVVLHEISKGVEDNETADSLAQAAFIYHGQGDVHALAREALSAQYKIPNGVSLVVNAPMTLEIGWHQPSGVYGIFLIVYPPGEEEVEE